MMADIFAFPRTRDEYKILGLLNARLVADGAVPRRSVHILRERQASTSAISFYCPFTASPTTSEASFPASVELTRFAQCILFVSVCGIMLHQLCSAQRLAPHNPARTACPQHHLARRSLHLRRRPLRPHRQRDALRRALREVVARRVEPTVLLQAGTQSEWPIVRFAELGPSRAGRVAGHINRNGVFCLNQPALCRAPWRAP